MPIWGRNKSFLKRSKKDAEQLPIIPGGPTEASWDTLNKKLSVFSSKLSTISKKLSSISSKLSILSTVFFLSFPREIIQNGSGKLSTQKYRGKLFTQHLTSFLVVSLWSLCGPSLVSLWSFSLFSLCFTLFGSLCFSRVLYVFFMNLLSLTFYIVFIHWFFMFFLILLSFTCVETFPGDLIPGAALWNASWTSLQTPLIFLYLSLLNSSFSLLPCASAHPWGFWCGKFPWRPIFYFPCFYYFLYFSF